MAVKNLAGEYFGKYFRSRVPNLNQSGHEFSLIQNALSTHPKQNSLLQALAGQLFVDSGIRAKERGIVSAGRNKVTGENNIQN
jgi:tryptophanase